MRNLFLFFLFGIILPSCLYSANPAVKLTEEKIMTLPGGVKPESLVINMQQDTAAYLLPTNGKWTVVLNNQTNEIYGQITNLYFPDHNSLPAYTVWKVDGFSYFIDGTNISLPYNSIRMVSIYGNFKPDAFVGLKNGKSSMVMNGIAGPEFDEIFQDESSSSSGQLGYIGRNGTNYTVMILDTPTNFRSFTYNGKTDALGFWRISNQTIPVWRVKEGTNTLVVVNGNRGPGYNEIGYILFYDMALAYEAKIGNKWVYVINGTETPGFQEVNIDTLLLSADGKPMIYAGWNGDFWVVYRNGTPSGEYADIYDVFLFPDLKTPVINAVDTNDMNITIIGGWKSEPYQIGAMLTLFSVTKDSKHWAFAMKQNNRWYLVEDGKKGQPMEDINQVVYGSDGVLNLVYKESGKIYIQHGKTKTGPFQDAGYLYDSDMNILSADGKNQIFRVEQENLVYLTDGNFKTALYDQILTWNSNPDGSIFFWAVKGKDVYRGIIRK